jgi:hypothetical protein
MASIKVHIEPETISLRLGKNYVTRLRDLALKNSVKTESHVTPSDIVKEALDKIYPDLFCGNASRG